jgi:hypothetical protein
MKNIIILGDSETWDLAENSSVIPVKDSIIDDLIDCKTDLSKVINDPDNELSLNIKMLIDFFNDVKKADPQLVAEWYLQYNA